ncbi:MAG: hypothetical protein ACD_37C00535G0001 [uncultured bacterium]|nr:MAG: hypothetical protein ACD_37C00535G0001 [uncultured bacterium]
MSIEAPRSRPRYDALLVHGYWMSEHRTGLGLRSRLSTRAAAIERTQGEAKTVFVNIDHLWGSSEPSEGELVAKELEGHYQIPHEDIILRQDAWSTGGEIKTFVEQARQHGWSNLLDVAFAKHHSFISILGRRIGTIPLIYKGLGLKPQYKSAEDILREKDIHRIDRRYKVRKVLDIDKNGNPKPWKQVPIAERQYAETGEERLFVHEHNHTTKLVNKLTGSKFEAIYFMYEGIKWTLMHRPGFNYEALEQTNRNSLREKGTDSPLSKRLGRLFDFDVYTLNGRRSPLSYKKRGKAA